MRDRAVALLFAAASTLLACAQGAQLEGWEAGWEGGERGGEAGDAAGSEAPAGTGEAHLVGDSGGVETWSGPAPGDEPSPAPTFADDCATPEDDDQDGEVNDGCACTPGTTQACYGGPDGTEGVGPCRAGVQACAADGFSWGPCVGEVVPAPEDINTPEDDDCTGTIHDSVCEENGILVCPSSVCAQVPICTTAGGVVDCVFPWRCVT